MIKVSSFMDLLGGVLTIALATTILTRGSQAAQVFNSLGTSFANVINAAQT